MRLYRKFATVAVIQYLLVTMPQVSLADPVWWSKQGVWSLAPESNLSVATIGQAKHMVSKALIELEPKLPPSAFADLKEDIAEIVDLTLPATPAEFEAQKSILVLGQLKALSKPFYDCLRGFDNAWVDLRMQRSGIRLHEPTPTNPFAYSPYPWTESIDDDLNKAIATIGQLKAAFSLPFESWITPDPLTPALPWGAVDTDGDGLSDLTEIALGLNPNLADTDGDGHPDWRDEFPLDPTRWHSSPPVITLTEPVGAVEDP